MMIQPLKSWDSSIHKNMVINMGIFLAINMGMCHHKMILHDPKMMVFSASSMAVGSKYQWESELSSPLGGTKTWRSIELMIRIEPTLKCEFCFQHKEPHWPNKCDLKRGYLTTWSGLALTLMDLKPSELLSNSEDSERVFCNLWHGFHEEICEAKKPSYLVSPEHMSFQ